MFDGKEKGNMIQKSKGHNGREEKEEASRIFREVWERCRSHGGYLELKQEFLREQKEWLKAEDRIKLEEDQETEDHPKRRKNVRIKNEHEYGTEPPVSKQKIITEHD